MTITSRAPTAPLADVRPGAVDDDPGDVLARVHWSGLVEPGDGVAGLLLAAVGAERALAAVRSAALRPAIVDAVVGRAGAAAAQRATRAITAGWERWEPRVDHAGTAAAVHNAARCGAQLVLPGDPAWPVGLDDLGVHAPLLLWLRGLPDVLAASRRSLAVVGSRAASAAGVDTAAEMAAAVAAEGVAVVSGAAFGVDGAAHRGALSAGGPTIAVIAGGPDRFYPSAHAQLLTHISRVGAVVAEQPPGVPPHRSRFTKRNRLIVAATSGTLVVEASTRSGSLNSASHALELGRPLGAVPGPIASAASTGTNRLIRDGHAVLVQTAQHALELVGDAAEDDVGDTRVDDDERRLRDALSSRPRDVADLAARTGLALRDVQRLLGRLDLAGDAEERDGRWRSIAPR